MAILLQDDFNRANNTTVIGSPQVGGPYTVRSGVWGINTNELYMSTPSTNAQVTFPAAINLSASMKVTTSVLSTTSPGLMIRWVDVNNYWLAGWAGSNLLAIYRCVANALTQMTVGFSILLGDVMEFRAYEDQIGLYINSEQLAVIPDYWFSTATAVAGVRNGGGSSMRADDLLAQDQSDPLNYWGSGPLAFAGPDLTSDAEVNYVTAMYKGRDTGLADESGSI